MAVGEVEKRCWETRAYTETVFLGPSEIVDKALSLPQVLVAVSESHDSTNSGAPGDSTLLLAPLCERDIECGRALTFCVDAGAVARCHQAGKGKRL